MQSKSYNPVPRTPEDYFGSSLELHGTEQSFELAPYLEELDKTTGQEGSNRALHFMPKSTIPSEVAIGLGSHQESQLLAAKIANRASFVAGGVLGLREAYLKENDVT